jgi:uncharacterized protein (TIGR02118 family)
MITVSVLYPKNDSSHFDHEYYVEKHIPLVRSTWGGMGLERIEIMRGAGTLDGGLHPYELIGALTFASMEDLQKAMSQGAEIFADIPNFTNVQPLIQFNQPVAI